MIIHLFTCSAGTASSLNPIFFYRPLIEIRRHDCNFYGTFDASFLKNFLLKVEFFDLRQEAFPTPHLLFCISDFIYVCIYLYFYIFSDDFLFTNLCGCKDAEDRN